MNTFSPIPALAGTTAGDAAAHPAPGRLPTSAPNTDSGFDSLIRRAGPGDPSDAPASEDEARDSAEELVAFALVMPLMKMARDAPFKSDLFHGGRGEEAFGNRLDQRLARQIVKGANLPLVDAVHRRLTAPGVEVDRHG